MQRRPRAYVRNYGVPIVVKADGLAAGKGVVVATSFEEAESAIDMMIGGGLGAAGAEVVIEAFLEGEEASFFALCDGTHAIPFGTAQDHKRVFDGDEGPNTGGMGAYSPAAVLTPELQARVMREIIEPTLAGMRARGTPYTGILYAGLMLTEDGPQLIEYNARLGDPETQVLLPRLKSDLVTALLAACDGVLDSISLQWSDASALTVVMAAKGYPGAVEKGSEIKDIDRGRKQWPTSSSSMPARSRTATGSSPMAGACSTSPRSGARSPRRKEKAYEAVEAIDWSEGFCRRRHRLARRGARADLRRPTSGE